MISNIRETRDSSEKTFLHVDDDQQAFFSGNQVEAAARFGEVCHVVAKYSRGFRGIVLFVSRKSQINRFSKIRHPVDEYTVHCGELWRT